MIPYNGYETSDYPYHPHSHPHTLAGDHSKIPRIFFKVPRVVPDQRDKFETEEIFKKNARDMEASYFASFHSLTAANIIHCDC